MHCHHDSTSFEYHYRQRSDHRDGERFHRGRFLYFNKKNIYMLENRLILGNTIKKYNFLP